jgi:hypothetical protein
MKLLTVVRLGVILGLAAASFPTQGRGQVVPSPYRFIDSRQEAGPLLAFVSPGTGRFGYGPKPGLALGGRYGIHLGGPIGAEGVVLLLPTNRDLIDPGRVEGDRVVGEVPSHLLLLDARLRLSLTGDRTWNGLNPILFAGGGVGFDLAGESSEEDALLLEQDHFEFGTSFEGVMGAGVRWFASDRFLVRADLGLYLWQLESPPGFREAARGFEGVAEKEWVSGPSFSLGAAFHF